MSSFFSAPVSDVPCISPSAIFCACWALAAAESALSRVFFTASSIRAVRASSALSVLILLSPPQYFPLRR